MGRFILSPEIREMLEKFYLVSGIRIGVYDTDFKILEEYPKTAKNFSDQRFCEKCKGVCPNVFYEECKKCDSQAREYIISTGEPYIYKCHMGFLEAMIPLVAGGETFCFLMIGQVRNNDEIRAGKRMTKMGMEGVFAQYAFPEGKYSVEEALEDYENMPKRDYETFKAYVYFLEMLAQKIYNEEYVSRDQTTVSRALMNFVKSNLYNDITIADFSKSVGLSTSYLAHSIAKELGTTFTKYLLVCRIEEAKRILRTTEMSVKKISVLLRYNDVSYFVRQFKRITGLTCTQYREQKAKTKY